MDEGFAPGIGEKLRAYVYLLVDPRTGRAFFAGRGRNDRCFEHLRAARSTGEPGAVVEPPGNPRPGDDPRPGDIPRPGDTKPTGRTFPALDRIRQIEAAGRLVRIDILRYGLSSEEARLVEAVANDALGLRPGTAVGATAGARRESSTQRTEAAALNTLLAKPAKIKRSHRVVLLRLGKSFGPGTSDAQLDETVHSGWKIARRWTDPQSRRSPQWAFAVVDDVVRGVYRIDGWKQAEPTPSAGTSPLASTALAAGPIAPAAGPIPSARPTPVASSTPARWVLNGERDPDLEKRYRGRSVSAYMSSGSQNPVTYVWCGPHWVNNPT
jgi:hypothetical protein